MYYALRVYIYITATSARLGEPVLFFSFLFHIWYHSTYVFLYIIFFSMWIFAILLPTIPKTRFFFKFAEEGVHPSESVLPFSFSLSLSVRPVPCYLPVGVISTVISAFLLFARITETARLLKNVFSRSHTRIPTASDQPRKYFFLHNPATAAVQYTFIYTLWQCCPYLSESVGMPIFQFYFIYFVYSL